MSVPVLPENADATQVRSALTAAAGEYRQLRSKPIETLTDDERVTARSLASYIGELDSVEKVLSRLEAEERQRSEAKGPRAGNDQPVQRQRTVVDQLLDDEGFKAFQRSGEASGQSYGLSVEGSLLNQRALISEGDPLANWGSNVQGAGTLVPMGAPIVLPPRQRRLFLRDLIPTSGTGLSAIPYIQELNPFANEGGASAVAEGAAKPEVTMQWIEAIAPVRKIAAWVPVTTEIIEDAPTLRGYINDRLTYMIKVREEVELLSGSGTGAHIRGILNQIDQDGNSVVQTQPAVGTNDLPATVAMAYAKIENVDGEADAIAIHPVTFWSAVASRHSTQFDAEGLGIAPSGVPNITWGLTPIRTRGIAQGKFLAGAFGTAAHIWDRSEVTIRVGNQHAEYFVSNKLVILAEERLALTVWRPDLFVYGDATVSAG